MHLEKNGKTYSVSEYPNKWMLNLDSGRVSVEYNVSKELYKTMDELKEFVLSDEMF